MMDLLKKEVFLSLGIGLVACLLPYLFRTDAFILISLSLTLSWLVCLVATFIRYRKKGLWFLVGLPFVLYWPTGLVLMTLACRHNLRACP